MKELLFFIKLSVIKSRYSSKSYGSEHIFLSIKYRFNAVKDRLQKVRFDSKAMTTCQFFEAKPTLRSVFFLRIMELIQTTMPEKIPIHYAISVTNTVCKNKESIIKFVNPIHFAYIEGKHID